MVLPSIIARINTIPRWRWFANTLNDWGRIQEWSLLVWSPAFRIFLKIPVNYILQSYERAKLKLAEKIVATALVDDDQRHLKGALQANILPILFASPGSSFEGIRVESWNELKLLLLLVARLEKHLLITR